MAAPQADLQQSTREAIGRVRGRALILGLAGIALTIPGVFLGGFDLFFQSMLVSYVLWLGVPLGALGLVMIRHTAGGTWLIMGQRIFEAATRTLWLLLAMGILIIIGGVYLLFPWLDNAYIAEWPIVGEKLLYLNLEFFLIRFAVYFAIWMGLVWLFNRWSAQLDETGNPMTAVALRRLAPVGIILFIITVTFASTDWGMSLEPEWFSTIYGVHWAISFGLTMMALGIITLTYLKDEPEVARHLKVHHYHNLGNFLLAFVILWTYISFSQFLIIWSGNVPEEIGYYLNREGDILNIITASLMLFHFLVPMLVLLFRQGKKRPASLRTICYWVLAVRVVDVYWVIAPSFEPNRAAAGAWVNFYHAVFILTAVVGIGGLTLWAFLGELGKRPLVPRQDPVANAKFAEEGTEQHA